MALNGISELSTNGVADKEKRQKAKLALAEQDRAARNLIEPGRYSDVTADITQLPTQWDFNTDTNVNEIIDNPNSEGLLIGRPWYSGSSSPLVTNGLFMSLDASDSNSYPGSDNTWFDTIGTNHATINGATYTSDDGGTFIFDGVNDTISIPHVSSLSLSTTESRTIQVWVKFDSLGPTGISQVPVFGKLSSASGFDGYWAGLYGTEGSIRAVTNGTSLQRISSSESPNLVTTDTWYLMTFISRISGLPNSTKVYINTTEFISAAHGDDTYNETNPLYLGYVGTGVGSLYLDGRIGACYFYTRELSSAEITSNFNATKSRFGF